MCKSVLSPAEDSKSMACQITWVILPLSGVKSSFSSADHFPSFQLKCPSFCVFRIDRVMYLFVLFCVFCLFETESCVYTNGDLACAKYIPGYLSSGKILLTVARSGGDKKY